MPAASAIVMVDQQEAEQLLEECLEFVVHVKTHESLSPQTLRRCNQLLESGRYLGFGPEEEILEEYYGDKVDEEQTLVHEDFDDMPVYEQIEGDHLMDSYQSTNVSEVSWASDGNAFSLDYETAIPNSDRSGILYMKKMMRKKKMRAVLFNYQLILFKNKAAKNPDLVINLKDAEIRPDDRKQTKFAVISASHKNSTYEFEADNCEERDDWVSDLHQSSYGRKPGVSHPSFEDVLDLYEDVGEVMPVYEQVNERDDDCQKVDHEEEEEKPELPPKERPTSLGLVPTRDSVYEVPRNPLGGSAERSPLQPSDSIDPLEETDSEDEFDDDPLINYENTEMPCPQKHDDTPPELPPKRNSTLNSPKKVPPPPPARKNSVLTSSVVMDDEPKSFLWGADEKQEEPNGKSKELQSLPVCRPPPTPPPQPPKGFKPSPQKPRPSNLHVNTKATSPAKSESVKSPTSPAFQMDELKVRIEAQKRRMEEKIGECDVIVREKSPMRKVESDFERTLKKMRSRRTESVEHEAGIVETKNMWMPVKAEVIQVPNGSEESASVVRSPSPVRNDVFPRPSAVKGNQKSAQSEIYSRPGRAQNTEHRPSAGVDRTQSPCPTNDQQSPVQKSEEDGPKSFQRPVKSNAFLQGPTPFNKQTTGEMKPINWSRTNLKPSVAAKPSNVRFPRQDAQETPNGPIAKANPWGARLRPTVPPTQNKPNLPSHALKPKLSHNQISLNQKNVQKFGELSSWIRDSKGRGRD